LLAHDAQPNRLAMSCPHCRYAIEVWSEPKADAADWLAYTFTCPKCRGTIIHKLASRFAHAVVLSPPTEQ
jgi:hypothetical protein